LHVPKASKMGEVKLRTSTQNSHRKNSAASKNQNEDLVIEIPTDRTKRMLEAKRIAKIQEQKTKELQRTIEDRRKELEGR